MLSNALMACPQRGERMHEASRLSVNTPRRRNHREESRGTRVNTRTKETLVAQTRGSTVRSRRNASYLMKLAAGTTRRDETTPKVLRVRLQAWRVLAAVYEFLDAFCGVLSGKLSAGVRCHGYINSASKEMRPLQVYLTRKTASLVVVVGFTSRKGVARQPPGPA
jgi:hypothetical protein